MTQNLVGIWTMKRNISWLLSFFALWAFLWGSAPGWAQQAPGPRLEGRDMVIGAADAPVTIIEYASLTCPHCASFHRNIYVRLKSEYVDRGLVRFVFRDFPLDNFAFAAAVIARCAGPERFFAYIDVMFEQQDRWTQGGQQQIMANLQQIARLGGMSDEAYNACLANRETQNIVLQQRLEGEQRDGVRGTPTLIINGNRYTGSLTFEALDAMLRPLARRS
jgi:protein-disulfide isomerase